TAHHHLQRSIAGLEQSPEIFSRQVRGKGFAVRPLEAGMTLGVDDACADSDELENLAVPFEPLNRQTYTDNSVGAHPLCLLAHSLHRQRARFVHGGRQHIQLNRRGPAGKLESHVINAAAYTQADRLKTGLADKKKLVDRKVGGEHASGIALASQSRKARQRVFGNRTHVVGHQIPPSSSWTSAW